MTKIRDFGSMFVFGDVIFNFYPSNDATSDVMLFPVPIVAGEQKTQTPTFTVSVNIWSAAEDLQLDASQIQLWHGSSGALAPISIEGPYECHPRKILVRNVRPVSTDPLLLKRGSCADLGLKFAIPPPDPDEQFAIKISGLSGSGQDIDLPVATFSHARKTNSVAMP